MGKQLQIDLNCDTSLSSVETVIFRSVCSYNRITTWPSGSKPGLECNFDIHTQIKKSCKEGTLHCPQTEQDLELFLLAWAQSAPTGTNGSWTWFKLSSISPFPIGFAAIHSQVRSCTKRIIWLWTDWKADAVFRLLVPLCPRRALGSRSELRAHRQVCRIACLAPQGASLQGACRLLRLFTAPS